MIQMAIDTSCYGLLMTAKPNASASYLVRCCEFAFESNPNVRNFGIGSDNTLALYASGRTTGLAIDFGEFQTRLAGYHEGKSLPATIRIWNIGSVHSSALTKRIVSGKSKMFQALVQKDVLADDIKQKLGNRTNSDRYELPNGSIIEIGTDMQDLFRYQTEGILPNHEASWVKSLKSRKFEDFEGSRIDLNQLLVEEGVGQHSFCSIVNSALLGVEDLSVRRELAGNLIVSGGGSMPIDDTSRILSDLSRFCVVHRG